MSVRYRWAVAALAAAWFWVSPIARAVIVDGANGTGSANTTGPYPVAGLSNVGIIGSFNPPSTAVYIGNDWALTASHVGPLVNFTNGDATFTVNGNTYGVDRAYQFTSGSGAADLLAFHLTGNPGLPMLNLSTASPALGTQIYSTGYGQTRSATMTTGSDGYSEYTESGPNVLRYGTAITAAPPTVTGSSYTVSNNGTTEVFYFNDVNTTTNIFSSTFTQSTATGFNTSSSFLSSGDSGGGVFGANNVLLGINDLQFPYSDQNGSTATYGDDSGYVDIATYESQIQGLTGVPEPGSLSLLALGAVPLVMRRRRRA